MISLRSATQDDLATLEHISKEAYGGSGIDADKLERYLRIQPDGASLAFLDKEPIGMVLMFHYESVMSVGALGVSPSVQGQGVGRILMNGAETWGYNKGASSFILDATPDGARLYEKLGYKDADTIHRFNLKDVRTYHVPKAIETAGLNDLAEVLEFDASIFGVKRERMLEVFLTDFAGRAFLSRDEKGKINGFVIAQTSTIGPWLAANATAAEHLLQTALSLGLPEQTRVMIPGLNKEGLAFLPRYGFERVRTLRHMVKGNLSKSQRSSICGQAAFALG
jgi:GNAT superfamily N-acetyltransferase